MKLTLIRDIKDKDFTLGRLFLNDDEFCFTCEDAVREEKIYGKTAIPAGSYEVILNYSNRFKKTLPLLLDVPNFSGIRIHSGNSADDTEGCILVGLTGTDNGVSDSRMAMAKLMPILQDAIDKGETIEIEVA